MMIYTQRPFVSVRVVLYNVTVFGFVPLLFQNIGIHVKIVTWVVRVMVIFLCFAQSVIVMMERVIS